MNKKNNTLYALTMTGYQAQVLVTFTAPTFVAWRLGIVYRMSTIELFYTSEITQVTVFTKL